MDMYCLTGHPDLRFEACKQISCWPPEYRSSVPHTPYATYILIFTRAGVRIVPNGIDHHRHCPRIRNKTCPYSMFFMPFYNNIVSLFFRIKPAFKIWQELEGFRFPHTFGMIPGKFKPAGIIAIPVEYNLPPCRTATSGQQKNQQCQTEFFHFKNPGLNSSLTEICRGYCLSKYL